MPNTMSNTMPNHNFNIRWHYIYHHIRFQIGMKKVSPTIPATPSKYCLNYA